MVVKKVRNYCTPLEIRHTTVILSECVRHAFAFKIVRYDIH